MKSRHSSFATLCTVCSIVLLALPGIAAGGKTLAVHGRVADGEGWPVAGVRVATGSGPKAAALTDESGRFSLSVPVGSLPDLQRAPLSVTVLAALKGWTFSIANGAVGLGLDLRIAPGPDGVPRFQVRSNDPHAASSVANDLVLDGDGTAEIELNFLGAKGRAVTPTAIVLGAAEEVTVTGVNLPRGAPPAPAAPSVSHVESPKRDAPPPVAAAAQPPPTRNPTPTPTTYADAWGTPASAPIEASARPVPAVESPASVPHPTGAVTAAPPSHSSGASSTNPTVDRTASRNVPASRGSQPPASGTASGSAPSRSSATAAPARVQAPSPAAQAPASPIDPPRERVRSVEPVPADGAARGTSRLPEPSAPAGSGAVVRVWGGRSVPVETHASDPDAFDPEGACACRIKGTVEVRSDRPLERRVRVVVSLLDAPAVSDTVELFMGSPRPFVLESLSCGVHELDVRPLDRVRLVLARGQGESLVDCRGGGLRQPRLVLQPGGRER